MLYLNRYNKFISNNEMRQIPNIKIQESSTDQIIVFKRGETRMDILSQKYYGTPYMGFLIRLANPEYAGMEFDIPNGSLIRIPYPLNTAVELYNSAIENYIKLEG